MSTGQWGHSEVKRERTETAKLFTEKGRSEQSEGYEVALSSWEREKRLRWRATWGPFLRAY